MLLLRSLENLPVDLRGGAVTIGNFDGVHRGHARLVQQLLASSHQVSGPAIVFTFDPHPVRLLRPEAAPPPLTWTDRKAALLADLGVSAIIAYPTDEALLQLSPADFFHSIVQEKLSARAMVEGNNFFFGRGRAGTIETLAQLCAAASINLEIVEPALVGGKIVSSSRVREAIQAGDVDLARQLLTSPYRIRGMVTHGAGRGSKLGFPTANLEAIDTLLPSPGVYAGRAFTSAGSALVANGGSPAAINIGPNPTFGEHALKVEVHLIDFQGPLYGQPLEVEFLSRIRSTQPFDSIAALKSQLDRDIAASRQIAARDVDAVG